MYTDQERLERAEIIGAKLIEYRPAVLLTLRIKYGLQDDVAEDIYSDTCCYMLSRGVELLQNLDCGGAIRRIAKNRALNYIRDHKRYSGYAVEDWDSWGKLADAHDPDEWVERHDLALILGAYIDQASTEAERTVAQHVCQYEQVTDVARAHNINPNTVQGIYRRIKIFAREYGQR
jgi:DNA-directed RNA polymerase specialized sigma24 family protein